MILVGRCWKNLNVLLVPSGFLPQKVPRYCWRIVQLYVLVALVALEVVAELVGHIVDKANKGTIFYKMALFNIDNREN